MGKEEIRFNERIDALLEEPIELDFEGFPSTSKDIWLDSAKGIILRLLRELEDIKFKCSKEGIEYAKVQKDLATLHREDYIKSLERYIKELEESPSEKVDFDMEKKK